MEGVNGIIVVDKPTGFTSHDVVNVIRKIYHTKKVGHTGTLDPEATGVLPVCIGKATKVCDMITFSDKEYIARVKLGIITDTQDIFGKVLETKDVNVSYDEVKNAVDSFVGEIYQLPPMYSAIKIGGKKLYELAREGIEVERKERKININYIELSDFSDDEFTIKVGCSKGTYIRTLCHDIGKKLGCGGVMKSLRRTKSSMFSIIDAYTLDEIKDMAQNEAHIKALKSIDSVFASYEKLVIDDILKKRVVNGNPTKVNFDIGEFRVYDKEENFLCIGKVFSEGGNNILKVVKAFY